MDDYFGPFCREVKEGGVIPEGYGIAYYFGDRNVALAMPIPFNLIVGLWRTALWWLMCPPWRFVMWLPGKARRMGFEAGFRAARELYRENVDEAYRRCYHG